MNLETITNILVDNAERFMHREPDMAMFPEKEVPKIYAAAAEGALRKWDFEATERYLFLAKQWARLLELGTSFFHSPDTQEKEAGASFLYTVALHDKLPKDVAVELADHTLERNEGLATHLVAKVLHAGGATEMAEELAYRFFNQGNFEEGKDFLSASGKRLTADEAEKFAGIALNNGRYDDAFKFYETSSLPLPKDRAKAIASSDIGERGIFYLFDRVVKYMDETKKPFTAGEFRDFGHAIFNAGHYRQALKMYERAQGLVSPEDYWLMGQNILERSEEIERSRTCGTCGHVWPTVSQAFDFLSRDSPERAKQRLAKYADALLDQPDFARIGGSNVQQSLLIYEQIGVPMPVAKALKAAKISEENKSYAEAAKFYAAAGMKESAKRMGLAALNDDEGWQKPYLTQIAFQAAGDEEGLAVASFIGHNLSR